MIACRLPARNDGQATLLQQGARRIWFGRLAANQHVDTLVDDNYQTFNHFARKSFSRALFFLAHRCRRHTRTGRCWSDSSCLYVSNTSTRLEARHLSHRHAGRERLRRENDQGSRSRSRRTLRVCESPARHSPYEIDLCLGCGRWVCS